MGKVVQRAWVRVVLTKQKNKMTAKEYLQEKHEWHRKHWNEHDHIDDDWWANEMEEYHQAQLKLLGIANVSKSALNEEWNAGYNRGCEDTHAAYKDQM